MVAACFLVLEWLLFAALQRNYTVFQYYSYVSLVGFFTLPLPIMVGFDGPRRFQWLYQPFVLVATWSLGFCQLIEAVSTSFQGTH
jgi:hypothetical protein